MKSKTFWSNRVWSVAVFAVIVLIGVGWQGFPGNWRPSSNAPWPADRPTYETAASWRLGDLELRDKRFIGLAISGGGLRAANFGAAVMLELHQRGLLELVDVMSGVSGGTLPIAYFALSPGKSGLFTEAALREAFGYDFVSSTVRRLFLPQNIYRNLLTDFVKSDILVQTFDSQLFKGARFADLKPYPKVLINATLLNNITRFTFTDEAFNRLNSSLAQYSISTAVSVSAAVPGLVTAVTLKRFASPPEYFHLVDGGMVDNLGIESIVEFLVRNLAGSSAVRTFPNGCVILLVDAATGSNYTSLGSNQSNLSLKDYFVNTHVLEGSDALFLAMRERQLRSLQIRAMDETIVGIVPGLDSLGCMCEFRHIALRHLFYVEEDEEDPDLATRVTQIPTNLQISKEDQNDLYKAAKLLVRELEVRKLLPDENLKLQCRSTP